MAKVKKATRNTVFCVFALQLLDTAFLEFYSVRISPALHASLNPTAPIAAFRHFVALPLMYLLIAMLLTEVLCVFVRGQTGSSRQNASNKPWYFCLSAFAVLILLYTAATILQLTGYSNPFLTMWVFLISAPQLFAFPGILLALSLYMLSEKTE